MGTNQELIDRIKAEVTRRYYHDTRTLPEESLNGFWLPLIERSVNTVLQDLDLPQSQRTAVRNAFAEGAMEATSPTPGETKPSGVRYSIREREDGPKVQVEFESADDVIDAEIVEDDLQ